MTKEQAKAKIAELIDKYSDISKKGLIRKYNEARTRNEFIEPFFEYLGWDMRNYNRSNEVATEESISNGRVDLSFKINGIPKFFLEAKPLSVDLDVEQHARQAINYSWNKGVVWAVLTDFESIKVFNAESESKSLRDKLVFEIKHSEYIEDFDRLWLLSRESVERNELESYAEKYAKISKRLPIDKKLFSDLAKAREILTDSFWRWNKEKINSEEDLSEGVQRILDRLIFIRVLEDRKLEPPILQPMIREWDKDRSNNKQLFPMLINKFRELDKTYDSNLFIEHACEDWKEYDEAVKKVINIFYGSDLYRYDFKNIPHDILGGVYESYLGYISTSKEKLRKDKKFEKLFTTEKINAKAESHKKRKSQGIYYTPGYIVDYIVKNTLGRVINEKNNLVDLKKIKILDPACGSGSFLVESLNFINQRYIELGYPGDQYTKTEILTRDIYGVDLDPQAIELAKLNLLIESLDARSPLPDINNHIRVGNSLMEDGPAELKPFSWREEFKEVSDHGGFDVIIGNPPYIKEYTNKSAFDGLRDSPYYQGKMDIWTLFACKTIDLLKDGGYLGFIAPSNWLTNAGASKFRDKVLSDGELIEFVDFGNYKIFKDAGIQTMIFIFKKIKPRKNYQVLYTRVNNDGIDETAVRDALQPNSESSINITKFNVTIFPKQFLGKNITFSSELNSDILENIKSRSNFQLTKKEVANGIHSHYDFVNKSISAQHENKLKIGEGIFGLTQVQKEELKLSVEENSLIKPYFTSAQLKRYYADHQNKLWIIYTDSKFKNPKEIIPFPNLKKHLDKFENVITSDNKPYGLHRARDEKFFKGKKIVATRKCVIPTFTYIDFDSYVSATFYIIKTERINQKYLVGLLNSDLIAFWLRHKGKMQGDNFQIDKEPLINLPLINPDDSKQREITEIVDKLIFLHGKFCLSTRNTDHSIDIHKKIENEEKKINQMIFKLYSLDPEEIKIIENSAK